MSRPLDGIRVLDLGTRIAAPFCAGLLGEQGAEIIKIEQPGRGDFMREIGPFAQSDEGPYSLFWAVEGRGRKSVTLDLRSIAGQSILRRLAATADVLVENFRPGTLERWSIAPSDLPDHLVTVRISTFGQDGPYSPRPGLDRLGIGYGGLLHLTGYPDRPPVRVGVTISDYLTGVFAAYATTSALYARGRARSGQGAVIDAALYGSALRVMEWTLAGYDQLGEVRGRQGNRLANSAPLDNYPTSDGKFVCIVAGGDANFARLCNAMERSDLFDDARFTTLAERAAHGDEINAIVGSWTAGLPADEIERRCVDHDVPVATAYTAADMFADPHFAARADIVAVDDPVLGMVRQQAPYPRRVGERPDPPAGAPRLGADTEEVLTEIGVTDTELAQLNADGVV